MLRVEGLRKVYTRGALARTPTFTLEADFNVDAPAIVGVLGPNGSGKTTLFELITGSNRPTSGRVMCAGQDIHRVRYAERARLAMHYHQSYQVRAFRKRLPSFLLERARSPAPRVHLFDEPQFSPQDGYIGFMLDFFRRLRGEGKVVFVCLHPNEAYHLELLEEICERFVFVNHGRLTHGASLRELATHAPFREYISGVRVNF
ncbi:MAG TPA: ATP-binding cassette domain-containing protein [Usitatibacter sp.]|nr:ATP-binding cassette domain-containing protein [Usitatibacter sp.]